MTGGLKDVTASDVAELGPADEPWGASTIQLCATGRALAQDTGGPRGLNWVVTDDSTLER